MAACGAGGGSDAAYPGASDAAAGQHRATAAEQPPRETTRRWAHFAELEAWPTVSEEPFPSQGHADGHFTAELKVSPGQADAYRQLRPGSSLPRGTVVAMLHYRDGTPGPIYAMKKTGAERWQFSVLDPDGAVAGSGSDLALCERCHAEAVADHLFGLPRPQKPSND